MTLLLIIVGFVFLDRKVANANFSQPFASDQPRSAYKYAEAALFALFPFGGFHQANYVSSQRWMRGDMQLTPLRSSQRLTGHARPLPGRPGAPLC
jgi:hypothetical protein